MSSLLVLKSYLPVHDTLALTMRMRLERHFGSMKGLKSLYASNAKMTRHWLLRDGGFAVKKLPRGG